ncbi:MAG: 5-formyltetrahydrofolate cyclo-ligase [Clostridia bacterium]|nr:5-formyltetrahydrofolate cyclo-ligase [Clostridia bacterium]
MPREIILTESENKERSRAHFFEQRKSISNESRFLLDTALFSNAAALPQFKEANTLLCYYPIKGEPNILPLVRHAQALGKAIAFPISHIKERRLSFHVLSDLSELVIGAYGIPEPPCELPVVTSFANSLCLVPALAFDKSGYRLGYGGGYYDRFLPDFNGVSLGLAYSAFFVDRLPVEDHDSTVDIIITENGGFFPYE